MEIIDFNNGENKDTSSEQNPQNDNKEKNKKQPQETTVRHEIISWIMTFAIAIAAAIILKEFVIINATVPTGSMENTIIPDDDLMGFRLAYLNSKPQRGDIIIFWFPDNVKEKFIKRVIGVGGDKVDIIDGKIYLNDSPEPIDEPYLKEEWVVFNGPYEFNVPEGGYLVLGDNRNDSRDARFWENTYVTDDLIIGKAMFIYYPFSHMKMLTNTATAQ